VKLFGDRSAPDNISSLKNGYFVASFSQIAGRHKPVVTTANNDAVLFTRPLQCLQLQCLQ
jgi:hypothetical protein